MDIAGKAILMILRHEAMATHYGMTNAIHVAERNDPKLASLMRAVLQKQKDLDDYVLSLTEHNTSR